MLIARHEQMLAKFVFSSACNRMDLSTHCRASNFTKADEVWKCFWKGLKNIWSNPYQKSEVRSGVKVKHKDWMVRFLGMS